MCSLAMVGNDSEYATEKLYFDFLEDMVHLAKWQFVLVLLYLIMQINLLPDIINPTIRVC